MHRLLLGVCAVAVLVTIVGCGGSGTAPPAGLDSASAPAILLDPSPAQPVVSGEPAPAGPPVKLAAAVVTLTFEGLQSGEPVQSYYAGGLGGNGSGPGPNWGITFAANALASIDADAGGSGNFGGEPSPDTAMTFVTGAGAVMNVPAGFDTGFSFYYTSPVVEGLVTVYDGPNATGNVLASLPLPLTPLGGAPDPTGVFSPFLPVGVAFNGVAQSVDFGGSSNQIGFDNITLGTDVPSLWDFEFHDPTRDTWIRGRFAPPQVQYDWPTGSSGLLDVGSRLTHQGDRVSCGWHGPAGTIQFAGRIGVDICQGRYSGAPHSSQLCIDPWGVEP